MSSLRVWFVSDRFEHLRDAMGEFGYALDPGPRDPNEWQELHREDPPAGLVRLKGVRLHDPYDEDSDFDPEITFSVTELWAPAHIDNAREERGLYLVEYSYHGHHHGADQRWDFDPARHPEAPYHYHPPAEPDQRRPAGQMSVCDALAAFDTWISNERQLKST